MSNTFMIFNSDYLEAQVKNFAQIRHDIFNVEWGFRKTRVLDGIECKEAIEFSYDLRELSKSLGVLKNPIENIIEVFRHAASHTSSDSEQAKDGADAMADKMKEKYGMEASSYNPSQIFAGAPNKTLPITPVPALASVIVSNLLVGLDKMPWVKNASAMTLSATAAGAAQEARVLTKSFEAEEVDSIFDVLYADEFKLQFRDYLASLYADA